MSETRLDDAEAVRILWDDTTALARDARRLTETADGLTHTLRAFAASMVEGGPCDPRALLGALGATASLCEAIATTRRGMEASASALGVAFVPNPSPHPMVQAQELAELRERIAGRALRLTERRRRP